MKIKNKLYILIPVLAVTGLLIFSGNALAQDTNGKTATIIQRIAEKFGLKEADVQIVFDDFRKEKQTQMQAKWEERLNQAVSEGKITEAQKQAILKKHEELKNTRTQNREDLEKWATDNGIDLKNLFPGWGPGMGMKGRWHFK